MAKEPTISPLRRATDLPKGISRKLPAAVKPPPPPAPPPKKSLIGGDDAIRGTYFEIPSSSDATKPSQRARSSEYNVMPFEIDLRKRRLIISPTLNSLTPRYCQCGITTVKRTSPLPQVIRRQTTTKSKYQYKEFRFTRTVALALLPLSKPVLLAFHE